MSHPIAGLISSGMTIGDGMSLLDSRIPDGWSRGACNEPTEGGQVEYTWNPDTHRLSPTTKRPITYRRGSES